MRKRTWKAIERAIAHRLGGRRLPVSGRPSPDVVSDWLVVEVKHRERLPSWLTEAVRKVRSLAMSHHLPIVVLHESGQRHDNDLVVMSLADFEAWFGEISKTKEGSSGDLSSSG